MKKRLLSILFSLVMLFSIYPMSVLSAAEIKHKDIANTGFDINYAKESSIKDSSNKVGKIMPPMKSQFHDIKNISSSDSFDFTKEQKTPNPKESTNENLLKRGMMLMGKMKFDNPNDWSKLVLWIWSGRGNSEKSENTMRNADNEPVNMDLSYKLTACTGKKIEPPKITLTSKSGKVYTENNDYSLIYYRDVYLNSNKPYSIEVDPENISDFGDYTVVAMPTRNGVLSGEARDTFTVVK
ncbi:MAG: hypothetical protein IJH61_08575 [Eubacteriaceae bacterium]|nr:hypothetical protein [Eubacteriaceae bacterium]